MSSFCAQPALSEPCRQDRVDAATQEVTDQPASSLEVSSSTKPEGYRLGALRSRSAGGISRSCRDLDCGRLGCVACEGEKSRVRWLGLPVCMAEPSLLCSARNPERGVYCLRRCWLAR